MLGVGGRGALPDFSKFFSFLILYLTVSIREKMENI
jgi:hypothetical protein